MDVRGWWGRPEPDRSLARYLSREVAPFSPAYGPLLGELERAGTPVRGVDDLVRLPLTRLAAIDDPANLVLRPDAERIAQSGDLALAARAASARLLGRQDHFNRSIDAAYKPVLWWIEDGLLMAASSEDERRLAELGRRWLEAAGVERNEALVSVLPPGPRLGFWQLVLGARLGGLSALFLDHEPDPAALAALRPGVLAGRTDALASVLGAVTEGVHRLEALRTVLVVGEALRPATRERLGAAASAAAGRDVAVVSAWAPPGVRALWGECRASGAAHLWSGAEVVEVVDRAGTRVDPGTGGELVWTPIGWRGSVVVRLRTGLRARIEVGRCEGCGARERVIPMIPERAGGNATSAS